MFQPTDETDLTDCLFELAFRVITGRLQEASEQYMEAIALEPTNTIAMVNAAETMKKLQVDQEAEDLYRRWVLYSFWFLEKIAQLFSTPLTAPTERGYKTAVHNHLLSSNQIAFDRVSTSVVSTVSFPFSGSWLLF